MIANRNRKIGIVALALGAIVNFCGAIIKGKYGDWLSFGVLLAVAVMLMIFYTGVLLGGKIDARYDRLEQLLKEREDRKALRESSD